MTQQVEGDTEVFPVKMELIKAGGFQLIFSSSEMVYFQRHAYLCTDLHMQSEYRK